MKRYVVVTGVAGALGASVARSLNAAGYAVVGLDLAPDISCETDLALCIGGVDLGDEAQVKDAFVRIGEACPTLHGLVNVAGGFLWEGVESGSIETWDLLYRLNLRTAFLSTRAALPSMVVEGGSIVNISAAGSVRAASGMGAYAASKAGVSKLTESLAEELKDRRVRVNAILPSIIDTPANRATMPQEDFSKWVQPSSVADLIEFLLSDRSIDITGALIPITGRL